MLEHKFQAMDRQEALQHFENYVAGAGAALARFRDDVAASRGPLDVDCSPGSMVDLWSWFLGRAEASDTPARFGEDAVVPAWVDADQPFLRRLAPATLWMVDGLAYYLAACLQRSVPGAVWVMGDEPRVKNYIFQNQPLVTGFTTDASPLSLVLGLVGEAVVRGDRRDPQQLRELYEDVLAEAAP